MESKRIMEKVTVKINEGGITCREINPLGERPRFMEYIMKANVYADDLLKWQVTIYLSDHAG